MRFLYKPFSIVVGLLTGFAARQGFGKLWEIIDDADPPTPGHREAPLGKIMAASVMKSVVMSVVTVVVQRASFKGFEHVTGMWAGEKELVPGGAEMDPRYPERRMS